MPGDDGSPARRPACVCPVTTDLGSLLGGDTEARRNLGEGLAEPSDDLALAIEDLDLCFHDRGPAGERDELDVEGDDVLGRRRFREGSPASPPPGRA